MTDDRLLTLLVALCCIVAFGVSATTLSSSVSTKPGDVIHIKYADLPLGRSQVNALKHEIEGKPADATAPKASPGKGSAEAQQTTQASAPTAGPSSQSNPSSGQRTTQAQASSSGQGQGPSPSLLDRLLSLLRALFTLLLALLAILVPLALLYRYRDRLRALLDSIGADDTPSNAAGGATMEEFSAAYGVGPTNAVYRTWLGMVRHAGVPNPESMTPGDCANTAIDRGLDPAAVRTLTREFEAVRYGNAPVTAKRKARVRESRSRLDGDLSGGDR